MFRLGSWTARLTNAALFRIGRAVLPSIGSRVLVQLLRLCSSRIAPGQQVHAQRILETAIQEMFEGEIDINALVHGIAPLLVDPREVDDFIANVLLTLSEDTNHSPRGPVSSINLSDCDSIVSNESIQCTRDNLISQYGLTEENVSSLPKSVCLALYEILEESDCNSICCCISLEPIFEGNMFAAGIVVIAEILRPLHGDGKEKVHLFFFNRIALFHWFDIGGYTNPITRNPVHAPSQVFQLS